MITFRRPTLDMVVMVALGIAGCAILVIAIWLFSGTKITVTRNAVPGPTSPITGLPCKDPQQRPITVMIGSDPEARPLSGLAAADMVFEMPVTPNGITRLMAVYQCGGDPKEIGAIRSARMDFIPLTQGLGAIYAHWGGEADSLNALNNHVTNNINALIYDGTVFNRKKNIPAPFNGFTTLARLRDQATVLGYSASASFSGYPHQSSSSVLNIGHVVDTIRVSWPQHMDVAYQYNSATNLYARSRGDLPEIDANTGKQVQAGVVIVMKTDASFLRDQYIRVQTLGKGQATIYQNGRSITATWHKTAATDMLTFTDEKNQPIPFALGSIWIEIDAPLPAVPSL